MRNTSRLIAVGRGATCAVAAFVLSACGGGSGGSAAPGGGGGATTFSVGGAITGLTASGLVLADNGADMLPVASGATSFTFATKLQAGATYDVTVSAQPTGERCSVGSSGTGTATANVTSIGVTCTPETFGIAGSISGLSNSGLQLQYYSGGEVLPVNPGATTFAFSQMVPYGTNVQMSVVTQPYWQWCTPGASNFSGPVNQNITGDKLSCSQANAHVTTLAGSTTAGSADGMGRSAGFASPSGVAIDASGNIYVADTANNEIRKVSSTGAVTTFAGSTTPGSADGTGAAASFYKPSGVAVDASGDVLVADYGNNEIRMITPAGVVTTLAGTTGAGAANGTGSAASFNGPFGIAVDSAGDIYVADANNNEIRMISPAGIVTTVAGSTTPGSADGTGAAASFNLPTGVAVDSSGNIFVADSGNNEIREVTSAGAVTTLAGSTAAGHADGTGPAASFDKPSNVAVDGEGAIYVTDTINNEIRKVGPTGVVTTLAGSPIAGSADGVGTSASFNFPFGIAVTSATGILYVGDLGNDEIRAITPGP